LGVFSYKSSIALAPKQLIGYEKVKGCKKWHMDFLYQHAKYGRDSALCASCRWKVWCFSVCFLSRFRITKFLKTETLLSRVIFNTITVPLHTGRFLVVPRGNFIPWRFWGLYSHNGEIRRKVADLGPPPMVNFVKVAEGNPSLMGKCKPKITNLDDFWGSKCTFLKLHRCNLTWGWGPGSPSHRAKFCIKNRLREFDPYGQIYTHFGDFELLKPTFFTLIMLKFDFISQRHKIVSESLKGLHGLPVLHWLGGDAYLFLQCSYYLCQGGGYAINAVCLWFVRSLSVIPPVCRITKISLINRFHQNETWSYTWAYQSEELLTFGGDLVSGTNSGSLFHFPHHCGIEDFRRFIGISTGRFSRRSTKCLTPIR